MSSVNDLPNDADSRKEQRMIVGLTGWMLRHRGVVVLSWLVLTVAGAVAANSLGGALSKKFSVPGAAIRTNERTAHTFGSGGSPLVPVVTVAAGDLRHPALAREADRAFMSVAAALPGSRLASYATTGDPTFLSADHRTSSGRKAMARNRCSGSPRPGRSPSGCR
jgi:RND superfamily putative drug exporter